MKDQKIMYSYNGKKLYSFKEVQAAWTMGEYVLNPLQFTFLSSSKGDFLGDILSGIRVCLNNDETRCNESLKLTFNGYNPTHGKKEFSVYLCSKNNGCK